MWERGQKVVTPHKQRTLTKKLLILGLEGRDTGLELVPTALVHLILLLHLPETVDGLADQDLRVGELPAERHDVLVGQRRHRLVVLDRVELAQDLAELLVLLGECSLLEECFRTIC